MITAEFQQALYYPRPSTEDYLRSALANITTMKLVVVFPNVSIPLKVLVWTSPPTVIAAASPSSPTGNSRAGEIDQHQLHQDVVCR